MANYWFNYDISVVKADDHDIVLTFKDSAGDPVDISSWSNETYRAEAIDSSNTDTIDVAAAAITASDSGTGTTDTFTIPLASTDTDITVGKYKHSFIVTVSSKDRTVFKGTIRIVENIAEVP